MGQSTQGPAVPRDRIPAERTAAHGELLNPKNLNPKPSVVEGYLWALPVAQGSMLQPMEALERPVVRTSQTNQI